MLKVNQEQLKVMLDSLDPKLNKEEVLTSMLNDGLVVEGFNDQKPQEEKGFFGRVGDALGNRAEQIGQGIDKFGDYNEAVRSGASTKEQGKNLISGIAKTASGIAGGIGDVVGEAVSEADQAITGGAISKNIGSAVNEFMQSKAGQQIQGAYDTYIPEGSVSRDVAEAFGNVASVVPMVKGAGQAVKFGQKIAKTGYNMGRTTVDVVTGAKNVATRLGTEAPTGSPIRKVVDDFFNPTTDEATLTSLNPFLVDNTKVSIPLGNNKYVVKEIGKDAISAEEKALVKADILNRYETYYQKSKEFMKDSERTAGYTSIDTVGQNIDKYVDVANRIRRETGKKMGEIEKNAKDLQVDLTNTGSLQEFVNTVDDMKGATRFAGAEKLTPEMKTFLKDLNTLQQKGASVKNVLNFTRDWSNKLEDLKDNFGAFTKDKRTLTNIERMVGDIKNQARNTLSEQDATYRELVDTYRQTSQLREESNRLLGKEGLYGDTVRGASTAKRAVKSVSDAGSRQFLLKLKELTGYDGMADARIALQAMEDAGDFKGLSLLEILKDGKSGILGNTTKYVGDKIRGDNKTRVQNFINKEQ